jgi:hypothetical protein
MLRPKLGIVVIWQSEVAGSAGYCSTAPLGPLWLCRTSGRYSRSQQYCPACGPDPGPGHEPVPHGWVLLPREQAWHDLVGTAGRGGSADGPASGATVSESDLRYLEEVFAELQPGTQPTFATPADVWAAARGWSIEEMERFRDLAGQRGLELLLRCKQIAEGTGQDPDGASG